MQAVGAVVQHQTRHSRFKPRRQRRDMQNARPGDVDTALPRANGATLGRCCAIGAKRKLATAAGIRAKEDEGCELKRRAGDRHALVALDRPQQLTHTLGVSDRGHVLYQHGLQRSAQVACRVSFRSTGRDRVRNTWPHACNARCAVSMAPRASMRRMI